MKVRVLPYKGYSESAKELVRALGPKAILKSQRTPIHAQVRKKVMVNWGNSSPAFSLTGVTVLNKPQAVANASNKLTALRIMKEAQVNVPDFSVNRSDAETWIDEERIVLCRTLLRANSGRGITIAKEVDQLIDAPLYVKYIRKEKEYRLHVFNGAVIDMVEKRRRSGFEDNPSYNKYIRSYEQGWVFVRDDIAITEATKTEAIKAVRALGLDFGAVDIVMGPKNKPFVLEVNTSPGLQGTTLSSYKTAVETWVRSVR
jgi:glutathione synthase/RimK-type ligase-like ATP-grasp enzyme